MKNLLIGIVFAALSCAPAFAQDVSSGKSLWEGPNTQCRNCHGRLGEGGFGPALSGRGLSAEEFQKAVRKPWGIMPAFVPEQVGDAELANLAAYFAGLPKVDAPAPWRVLVQDKGPVGQNTAISMGCAQCHGVTFDIARGIFGGTDTSFAQFRELVYDHQVAMPKLGIAEGNTPGERLHMGKYDPFRVSDQQLREIYDWAKNDLGFRPFLEARLTTDANDPATYNLKIENSGFKQKGLTAQTLAVDIVLPPGVTVVRATGEGYKGVHSDAAAQGDVAEWQLPKLGPAEERSLALTLSAPVGKAGLKGSIRWDRPAPKTGAKFDMMNVALRSPPPNPR